MRWGLLWLVHFDPSRLFRRVGVPSVFRCCTVLNSCCCADRGDLCFRNFNSTIPVNVIRKKSYVDSFLDPTCVPARISINNLDLFPNWIVAGFVGVFRNGSGLVRASRIFLSCSLILSPIGLPVSPMKTWPHSHGKSGCQEGIENQPPGIQNPEFVQQRNRFFRICPGRERGTGRVTHLRHRLTHNRIMARDNSCQFLA